MRVDTPGQKTKSPTEMTRWGCDKGEKDVQPLSRRHTARQLKESGRAMQAWSYTKQSDGCLLASVICG